MSEVRANAARLEACTGPHNFQPSEWWKGAGSMVRRYTCAKCQGSADPLAVSWYEKGLQHGALSEAG